MFITYIHRTQESRNTKNTYDFLVQVRNFLLPLSLRFFDIRRERHNLSMLTFPSARPQHVWHSPQNHCELAKVTLLLRTARLNSDFFQISQNLPHTLPVHDVIHIPGHILSLGFYFEICERHIVPARASIPVLKSAPN